MHEIHTLTRVNKLSDSEEVQVIGVRVMNVSLLSEDGKLMFLTRASDMQVAVSRRSYFGGRFDSLQHGRLGTQAMQSVFAFSRANKEHFRRDFGFEQNPSRKADISACVFDFGWCMC